MVWYGLRRSYIIAIAAVVGAGSFYAGVKYAESKSRRGALSQNGTQNFRNLTPEERQQRMQELGANARSSGGNGFRQGPGGRGGSFVNGEIISKDDKGITVKLRTPAQGSSSNTGEQSGSKIILLSDSTEITKPAKISPAELQIGLQIVANGTPNQDGSITAQSIQLRPQMQNQ